MRFKCLLGCVALWLAAFSAPARADDLAACGVTDAAYTAAIQSITDAGYRDLPIVTFFEDTGPALGRKIFKDIETGGSDEEAIFSGFGAVAGMLPLMRLGNSPPKWDGDRRQGDTRAETIENTLRMFETLRGFAHQMAPPPALRAVGEQLAACDEMSRRPRNRIRDALAATTHTPVEARIYAGEGGASDMASAIQATFGDYETAKARSVASVESDLFDFFNVVTEDVCRRLRTIRGDESHDDLQARRDACAFALIGGGGDPSLAQLFGFGDLSAPFFSVMKVAGAAQLRGGARISDPHLYETVFALIQAQQPSSVDTTLRVLALGDSEEARKIQAALDEISDLQMNVFDPGAMATQFTAGDIAARNALGRREDAAERAGRKITDQVIRLWRDQPDRFAGLQPVFRRTADFTQAALREDEALLFLDHETLTPTSVAVTREGVFAGNANVSLQALHKAKADVNASIDAFVNGAGGLYDTAAAATLYQAIVTPVADAFVGKRRVFIITNAAATGVPFDALVSETPAAGAPARYWIDDVEVVLIPSIESLYALRTAGTVLPQLRSFAAVSDPTFAGPGGGAPEPASTGSALLSLGANFGAVEDTCALPRVRATSTIADTLAASLSPVTGGDLREDAATEGGVRALVGSGALASADVLAFNTHGLLARQTPARLGVDPALAVLPDANACAAPPAAPPALASDGFLTAAEISGLVLDVPLVLLTACNTVASGAIEGNAPLTGLARAFFAAGAKAMVVSNWDALVGDGVGARGPTEQFVDALFDEAATGSFSAKVRSAKLEVRETYPHPAAWAVFSHVGAPD